jgi:Phage integrase family
LLRSDTVPADFIDGTQGHIRQDSERLWLSVPVGLRRLHLVVGDTPEWEGRFSRGKKVCTLLDLRDLPEAIACEMLYAAWRLLDLGAAVHVGDTSTFLRDLRRALKACAPARASLMDAPVERWEQDLLRACAGRRGKVPDRWDRQRIRSQLHRIYFAVYSAYDTRPWWRREIWDAENDPRIPLREHEPRTHALHFTDVHPLWLRDGLRYFLGMQMQTGALSMASARSYLISTRKFGRYLQDRGVQHPRLAEDREGLRDLVLGWRGEVASMRSERTGGPLSKSTAYQYLNHPENLYGWLLDHRADLARAVGDDRWLALGIEHTRFYQPGERPRSSVKAPDEEEVIEDAVMTRVLSVAGELGRDVSDGGAGDPQAERMLLLLAKTGRRVMEILQLDFDPLLPLAGDLSANDSDDFAAKLRYQQTKIEGAPDTILVDRETVAIIEAQRRWAREWLESEGIDAEPKYLFMRPRMNRNAARCYAYATFRQRLSWLAETHDLKDSRGRPVVLTRTHRFRHTQATSLINAGVPLHVVQRYFGHLSPTMTMRYARTLAETHEREFLRYRKVTADGRQLDVDPRDLYDMLELDKRADRILPNGYCLLPPRQSCDRGNACLTCDKFATDRTHLDEHQRQLSGLLQIVDARREQFQAKTGREMPEDNVWLRERRKERRALQSIIAALNATAQTDQAVRGAGVQARLDEGLA